MLSYNRPCLPEELNMKGHRIFMSNAWDLNDFHYIFTPTNAMSTEYIIENFIRIQIGKQTTLICS